jgi:hypothetical protein
MAWFAPLAIETRMDGGQAPADARFTGCAVTNILLVAAVALAGCGGVPQAQTEPTPQEQSAAVAGTVPASHGLQDLDAMTFSCPKAALNAAARAAAEAPALGAYQFSYFEIVSESHDATYEIHFTSNYEGESDLKYCVSIYCQQGWDPATTEASVTLIGDGPQPEGAAAHGAGCGDEEAPAQPRSTP